VKAENDLEHSVWKQIKHYELQDKKILVALSGGVDSVALLALLKKTHKSVSACYFHHGEDSNQEYRKEAQIFCEKLCKKLEIGFFALKSSMLAKSEAEYRDNRYAALQKLMRSEGFDVLALGHHRDDLLETRLLRLIRGTGGQGLQAMDFYKNRQFRPLLETSKKDLKKYLRSVKLRTFEDPSNESREPLRNWLREEWLVSLEKRQKGAVSALARSLELISHECAAEGNQDLLSANEAYKSQGLSRAYYLTLNTHEQKRLLAQYLWALNIRNFSSAQLEEVQKRLDKTQKVITFKISGCEWDINAEQIKVLI
jgi:tRNA(Ile)-lysidine synthetase, N-terminal domain